MTNEQQGSTRIKAAGQACRCCRLSETEFLKDGEVFRDPKNGKQFKEAGVKSECTAKEG